MPVLDPVTNYCWDAGDSAGYVNHDWLVMLTGLASVLKFVLAALFAPWVGGCRIWGRVGESEGPMVGWGFVWVGDGAWKGMRACVTLAQLL